jgi:hypothetical protein
MTSDLSGNGGKTVEDRRPSLAAAEAERNRALAIVAAQKRLGKRRRIIDLANAAEPDGLRNQQSDAITSLAKNRR